MRIRLYEVEGDHLPAAMSVAGDCCDSTAIRVHAMLWVLDSSSTFVRSVLILLVASQIRHT